jgi:hypothetical protein
VLCLTTNRSQQEGLIWATRYAVKAAEDLVPEGLRVLSEGQMVTPQMPHTDGNKIAQNDKVDSNGSSSGKVSGDISSSGDDNNSKVSGSSDNNVGIITSGGDDSDDDEEDIVYGGSGNITRGSYNNLANGNSSVSNHTSLNNGDHNNITSSSHDQDIKNTEFIAKTLQSTNITIPPIPISQTPVMNGLMGEGGGQEEQTSSQEEMEELRISSLTFECFLTLKTRYLEIQDRKRCMYAQDSDLQMAVIEIVKADLEDAIATASNLTQDFEYAENRLTERLGGGESCLDSTGLLLSLAR